jgi:hypothetical protein
VLPSFRAVTDPEDPSVSVSPSLVVTLPWPRRAGERSATPARTRIATIRGDRLRDSAGAAGRVAAQGRDTPVVGVQNPDGFIADGSTGHRLSLPSHAHHRSGGRKLNSVRRPQSPVRGNSCRQDAPVSAVEEELVSPASPNGTNSPPHQVNRLDEKDRHLRARDGRLGTVLDPERESK